MIVPLPRSGPICHIPPFISVNYHKKKASRKITPPAVHLIMRPHTELLDAAHHCSGQPDSNPHFHTQPTLSPPTPPAATPACRVQASWQLTVEGGWCAAVDPPAPLGLAGRTSGSMGSEPGLNINKRNVRDLTVRGSAFFLPYMKHHTD